MDSNYDRKFEEMKQYIPFLESMIRRLETTNKSSTNPRQAQLDKIRSLRDLLLDERKRMKMENLLKCEQVLVNLYAKVEPKDALPGIKKASEPFPKPKVDLSTARNKLKTVSEKATIVIDDPDTLTEIAPASETEVVCTPGSKEPALFQRRPNKTSLSPQNNTFDIDKKSPQNSVPKRNYTRVLVSPEPSPSRWSSKDEDSADKPLFSRRSPRRLSPAFKKEKKKSSKVKKSGQKDLNITLNVPEESLNSLNTGDILSRIIKCPDNDVDIDTLRDLRTQILGELKQTGANDDISDLILKSYKKKKKIKANKKKEEVEEGELSDSESEAINSIYGSLVVVDKEKSNVIQCKTTANKEKPSRKIQICLVINSDKDSASKNTDDVVEVKDFDLTDDITDKTANNQNLPTDKNISIGTKKQTGIHEVKTKPDSLLSKNKPQDIITIEDEDDAKKSSTVASGGNVEIGLKSNDSSCIDISSSDNEIMSPNNDSTSSSFKANFYKPINDQEAAEKHSINEIDRTQATESVLSKSDQATENASQEEKNKTDDIESPNKNVVTQNAPPTTSPDSPVSPAIDDKGMETKTDKSDDTTEIPLLDLNSSQPTPAKKDVVSEIDILQALKNEILSDSIAIPGADTVTPALHQPKVTKVASAQQIVSKKRISIDNYKAKSASTSKPSLFLNDSSNNNDNSKKQSLKLTEEECERFNFPAKLALDDSSDDEDKQAEYASDNIIYKDIDMAPKSPENCDETTSAAPIIIPVEPVKPTVACSKTDVDMRANRPLTSPNIPKPVPPPSARDLESIRPILVDPRIKHFNSQFGKDSPSSYGTSNDGPPRSISNLPNMTPNSRPYEMTPSRSTIEFEENSGRKHVYASFPSFENRDYREHSLNRDNSGSRWEPNSESNSDSRSSHRDSWKDRDRDGAYSRKWNDRDRRSGTDDRYRIERHSHDQRDDYSSGRLDGSRTPVPSFGRSDCPTTPIPSFGRDAPANQFIRSDCPSTPINPFGRTDCPVIPSPFRMSEAPMTPSHSYSRPEAPMSFNHPYGRSEAPMTPSHSFGRSEPPMTPSHPFGRSEAPMTPSHPFGRSEQPMTPSHPFGRSEAPLTPSHPFGQSEAPMTPSHQFGRSEVPMSSNHPYGRSEAPMTPSHQFGRSDYSHSHHNAGPKSRIDPRLNRSSEYDYQSRKYGNDRDYYKDRRRSDFTSQGRYEPERHFSRDYDHHQNNRQYSNNTDTMRNYQRAPSQGRSNPSDELYHRSSSRARSVERNRFNSGENTIFSVKQKSGRSFTIDTSVNTTFQEFLTGKGLQIFDYSQESRNRRATSVGRALIRDSSPERTTDRNIRGQSVSRNLRQLVPNAVEDTSGYKRMVNFVRARSMGRDVPNKTEKSLKDIKADFESYRNLSAPKTSKDTKFEGDKISKRDPRKGAIQSQQNVGHSKLSNKKAPYSPRKNYRDPRVSRGHYDGRKNRQYEEEKKRQHGIVYSNDNIAKGTILGSGYGVKNYKIPKIKRPVIEEKKETDIDVSKVNKDKKSTDLEDKNVAKKDETDTVADKLNKEFTKVCKGKKGKDIKSAKTIKDEKVINKKTEKTEVLANKNSTGKSVLRTRKAKKVIIESDSESEECKKREETTDTFNSELKDKSDLETAKSDKDKVGKTVKNDIVVENVKHDNGDSTLDTSFGIDELEMFPENIAESNSISALIADLDNDLKASNDQSADIDFAKDISFDALLREIENEDIKEPVSEEKAIESLQDIAEVIKEDLCESDASKNETSVKESIEIKNKKKDVFDLSTPTIQKNPSHKIDSCQSASTKEQKENCNDSDISPKTQAAETTLHKEHRSVEDKMGLLSEENKLASFENIESSCNDSDTTVTTTELQKDSSKNKEEVNEERCSTPDSTININESVNNKLREEELPDSTNEKRDMHSDVTSTHDQTLQSSAHLTGKDGPSTSTSTIDPIGNLLSILQDKSKIKELLCLLDSKSSDNEKIKKKLEKLSAIVSDDEDTNDGNNEEVVEKDNEKNKEIQSNTSESRNKIDQPTSNESIIAKDGISANDNIVDEPDKETDDADQVPKKTRKVPAKRKAGKWKSDKKIPLKNKRMTRSNAANLAASKTKKPSRELKQLHESLKEMFISDDVLNATGIRMCRLAKLVGDKNEDKEESESTNTPPAEPVVVLEKINGKETFEEVTKIRKKPGPKPKNKAATSDNSEELEKTQKDKKITTPPKYKPGPKSKKKISAQDDSDPYSFEDTISETTTDQVSENNSSDSDNDSLASSKSNGSSEVLAELKKKPKRKRRSGWQSGIIKTKKRKKTEIKPSDTSIDDNNILSQKQVAIPDMNCFTDKTYCFLKNITKYSCRLCEYSGEEIVKHYKTDHPHTEVPLSRMSPVGAREAIEQCGDINIQVISKMITEKYVCRFCFKELSNKRTILEEFFWHVVSMHTGEYKQLCSECLNVTRCPFNLDIPPPPKDLKGQLIGYICGKCNFTQISLENIKTHVILRHNDEQTAVYTINLSTVTKKVMSPKTKQISAGDALRVLRSSRSNQSLTETSERSDRSEAISESTDRNSDLESLKQKLVQEIEHAVKPAQISKLSFENEDSGINAEGEGVKVEREDSDDDKEEEVLDYGEFDTSPQKVPQQPQSSDIQDYAHFKIHYGQGGTKEYVCCINGKDNHYKTALLISMKRHIQTKHSEQWDGYCSICKVIVMTQGNHHFKECLQHLLDKHIDDFPVFEENNEDISRATTPVLTTEVPITQSIKVRPLCDLISKDSEKLPKIENVMSLGENSGEDPEMLDSQSPSTYPSLMESTTKQTDLLKAPTPAVKPAQIYKYEEYQSELMSKKHRVILDAMLVHEKLIQIFKCSGRYCSFSTDSAEAAVLHASTHQRIGGENSLNCSYCDFDCKENAIDLVMHVFKAHGRCPFVCGLCFYRAAASQLVAAHTCRAHKDVSQAVILQTETVAPGTDDISELLPREVAVQHYTCAEANKTCKFKTYTQGKFIDHQLSKHTDGNNLCFICDETASDPSALVQHMKTHGLRFYQCTWCVDGGGDNETDFLAHASARHPSKEPQAYLRIITTTQKDGALKTMVLPLAKLNKSNVPTLLVLPPSYVEDPTREANRSLDLEKIITSMPLLSSEVTRVPTPTSVKPGPTTPEPSSSELTTTTEVGKSITESPHKNIEFNTGDQDVTLQPTARIKVEQSEETVEKNNTSPVVICLDSDDEVSGDSERANRNVIDISDEDQASNTEKFKRIDSLQLYKCPKCKVTFKSLPRLKKHGSMCCVAMESFKCVHCSHVVEELEELYVHYIHDHGTEDRLRNKPVQYVCGICNVKENNMSDAKAHVKKEHNFQDLIMMSKFADGGAISIVITGTNSNKPKRGPKRKLSGGPAPENIPKRSRYGPRDLDKLPQKPILDELTYCSECEFSTKVRLNLVRHFQQHAEAQLVPQTAPVNPVPHLETNQKHFDKMVNLASSSLETARIEKPPISVRVCIPPEAAARFPKYVPDRQRYTCGAKGCSYISLDEAMLKYHWETLHAGSNDFHCVHCPPYQTLDTSKPLTASRIIGHLKMHDIRLYSCSACSYYHYKKQVLDKHITEVHKGAAHPLIVREESVNPSTAATTTPPANAAPTMDLKPWKCGLCSFKSMLRPEVMEHCAKIHNSKMQFKCPVCPYRASSVENVTKHQSKSHPGCGEDIFYYYYREGSIPDELDGTPRWMKQRQKMGNPEPEVKAEVAEAAAPTPAPELLPKLLTSQLNLDIVKKEIEDDENVTKEYLCQKFGDICDPNGLKYKCPLCKLVTEDTKDSMQSHLFEELQYRKWSCSICYYKAFHKTGLNEHIFTEHRMRNLEPRELPVDTQVERWVEYVLEHQSTVIETNKANLALQKIQTEKPASSSLLKPIERVQKTTDGDQQNDKEMNSLIEAFGVFGSPDNMNFSCPKCDYLTSDEGAIKNHLQDELNKIRWRCSSCGTHSQNYHEAQLHTKTCKNHRLGQPSRPVEAIRDPSIRAAWLAAAIRTQKLAMNQTPDLDDEDLPSSLENSLLVVRYEEDVPTPEVQMLEKRKRPASTAVSAISSPDSDDERLIIDEPRSDVDTPKKNPPPSNLKKCSYCNFATKYTQTLDDHILRHYNLKPLTCHYCQQNFTKSAVANHFKTAHPNLTVRYVKTRMPSGPPSIIHLKKVFRRSQDELANKDDEAPKVVCLVCEQFVLESETGTHRHDKHEAVFAKKGDVVVKCCHCLLLFTNASSMQAHHYQHHSKLQINYAYYKLHQDTREILQCGHCAKRFRFIRDLKTHHVMLHSSLMLKYEMKPFVPGSYEAEFEAEGEPSTPTKRYDDKMQTIKRVARKSTTKLPSQAVAKKSTTKLPYYHFETENLEEYSFYGTKPTPLEDMGQVTTVMSIANSLMPVSMKKISDVINVSPVVLVKDCKK